MAMSENKNPPLYEDVELEAVDLEKQPKRVRKAEAKPPTRKKSTSPKKTSSKDEKNIARGTKKKLLPLPFEVAKRKPFKGRKIEKPDFKGIVKKDLRKRDFSRKPAFKPEVTEKACSGKEGPFLLQVFQAASIDPHFTQGFHHYPGRIPLQMAKLLLEHFGQKLTRLVRMRHCIRNTLISRAVKAPNRAAGLSSAYVDWRVWHTVWHA